MNRAVPPRDPRPSHPPAAPSRSRSARPASPTEPAPFRRARRPRRPRFLAKRHYARSHGRDEGGTADEPSRVRRDELAPIQVRHPAASHLQLRVLPLVHQHVADVVELEHFRVTIHRHLHRGREFHLADDHAALHALVAASADFGWPAGLSGSACREDEAGEKGDHHQGRPVSPRCEIRPGGGCPAGKEPAVAHVGLLLEKTAAAAMSGRTTHADRTAVKIAGSSGPYSSSA